MIDQMIAHYQILEKIGAGGMGEVYRARDIRLDREVAVKILPAEMAADSVRLQRFQHEARHVSALNHPNILTLHEIGESESGPYIVTELIRGRTVRELASDRLHPDRVTDLILQAADGLAKAHEAGIVHRDVKPDNLMVTDDGYVKILDFGLAKLYVHSDDGGQRPSDLTRTGTVVGTAAYLAPERLYGASGDARSDVFSLGVVWHELLHGAHPFLKPTLTDTLRAIANEEPHVPAGSTGAVFGRFQNAMTSSIPLPRPGPERGTCHLISGGKGGH